MEPIAFTKAPRDANGNPRLICHYSVFTTDSDMEKYPILAGLVVNGTKNMTTLYDIAVMRAGKIGGRRHNTKKFGGGIIFKASREKSLQKLIQNYMAKHHGDTN